MNTLFLYCYLALLSLIYSQDIRYKIEPNKSNSNYYMVYLNSNRNIESDILKISQECFDEIGEELLSSKKTLLNFSDEELSLINEYRIYGNFVIGSSGTIEQIEFGTRKNPSMILSLVQKIEKKFREEFRLDSGNCRIPEGKYVSTNMGIKQSR